MDDVEGLYDLSDMIYTQHRIPALLHILKETRAHIVALQEVTPEFFLRLKQEEWVRQHYYISDITGNSVKPVGNLLLSRFPFDSLEQRSYIHYGRPKTLLLGHISSLNGRRLSVAVVHLKAGTAVSEMKKQLNKH